MRQDFIEAALLVRVFFATNGGGCGEWQKIQAYKPNTNKKEREKEKGKLQRLLMEVCPETVADAEVFDDIDRWKRFLIEKMQVNVCNHTLEERLSDEEERSNKYVQILIPNHNAFHPTVRPVSPVATLTHFSASF